MESTSFHVPAAKGRIMGSDQKTNRFGKIDGVFIEYDEENDNLEIRANHSEIPEFWTSYRIPVGELLEWLGNLRSDPDGCELCGNIWESRRII